MISATVDSTGFAGFCQSLASMGGKDFRDVLVDQTGAVLKLCIKWTAAAKPGAIQKRISSKNDYHVFESGHVVSIWRKAGGIHMFLDESNFKADGRTGAPKLIIGGKTWHQMDGDRHWSVTRWARYQAMLAEAERLKKDPKRAALGRGIVKQSWIQIADDLGLPAGRLDAPAYAIGAKAYSGATYKNGAARAMLEVAAAYIEISNDNPALTGKLNGHGILQRAISARLKSFQYEIENKVFEDASARAKRYPGIFVAPA